MISTNLLEYHRACGSNYLCIQKDHVQHPAIMGTSEIALKSVPDGIHQRTCPISPTKDDLQSPTSSEESITLKRELGLFSGIMLIVGVMIGSGIFVSPTGAMERSGSVGLCLIVWALCGIISLFGALTFAELGTMIPRSGAEYAYFQEAYTPLHKLWGPLPSFITSWVYVLVLRPAEVAVVTLTFAQYVTQLMGEDIDPFAKKLVALLALGLMTFINFMSVKLYIKVQNVFTISKLVVCFIIIIGGIYRLSLGHTEYLKLGFQGTSTDIGDIALAFYSGLWAYDGWSTLTIVTEEVKNPGKNIPRSISIGLPLVTIIYVFMNVAYLTVMSPQEMIDSTAVAVTFGDRILGPFGILIPLGVAISTFGCAMSIQFSVTRLCFVAGREGHMLEALSYVHLRRFTPAPAVILQGIATLALIMAGNIGMLIDVASLLIWIFYGFAMVALLILRRTKPHLHRPYKVPTVLVWLVLFVSIFLTVVPLVTDPRLEYLLTVAFVLLGVIVYIIFVYKQKSFSCMDKFTYVIQALMEVVPPGTGNE